MTRVGGWTETRYTDGAPRLSGAVLRNQRNIVGETTSRIFEDADLASNLLNTSPSADFLKDHAYKSSLLSVEIASASGLTKQEALHLGLSALLQDMGMATLDEETVNKRSPLTPTEIAAIRSHPNRTVDELLRSGTGLPTRVIDTVLTSHERPNGTGYPQGLSGQAVDSSTRILSAANVYVALTSRRPYRPAWGTYDAVFFMIQAANQGNLDKNVVRTLLSVLSLFPVGTLVEMSTGEIARVVSTNEHAYTRPVVSILFDARGKQRKPLLIDLVSDTDYEIAGIADPETYSADPMLGF